MICPPYFNQKYIFYPLGNTPPVSLTQDLPPEQDADILLLGCGDVRNVLFTCFADVARKIDVTCCDIEPLVHARNVLLYSLLIEDAANLNIEKIWNIYYHWKLDKESLELLETQTQKLLEVSESIEQWHGSVYGTTIRFCDVKSLTCIRSYWMGFRSRGLSESEKASKLKQMQAAIARAQAVRNRYREDDSVNLFGIYPAYPIGFETIGNLSLVSHQWWDYGTVQSSIPSSSKATELNPALLLSPNPVLQLCCNLHPLVCIPVCTALTPITAGSAFHVERKDASPTEYLVDCAQNVFKQWATAFRKAVANKLAIRIFCGDAVALSFTLRNYQLPMPERLKPMDLPCDSYLLSSVELFQGDYGNERNAAPLNFDIVDTSNLVDVLGPLNLIPVASALLKNNAASTLYTEMLILRGSNLINRLNDLFGVDLRTMSLLLGLVVPDIFTNATNIFEEDPIVRELTQEAEGDQGFARSRLRWRRMQRCQKSDDSFNVHMEAKELARFLIQVHGAMFKHEDIFSLSSMLEASPASSSDLFTKISITHYTRASFASLLSLFKSTIVSDWDECVDNIYENLLAVDPYKSMSSLHTEDLLLNMHLYGIDNGRFEKPTPVDVSDAILAPLLRFRDLPEQLCVTTRVPRKHLGIYTRMTSQKMGTPTVTCTIRGKDSGEPWFHTFSIVQMKFGTWHEQVKDNELYPYITEDIAQQSGTSDMFLSVMVPTKVLLQSKRSVPWVMCDLVPTCQNQNTFSRELGKELCFARNKITSKKVFITRFMPGMLTLPVFSLASVQQIKSTSAAVTVRLRDNEPKVKALIQRITLESQTVKDKLALPSSAVEIKFKSPMRAVVTIAQSEELQFEFPVPVSPSKYKIRVARKSSYIEVETPLFDPLSEDAASFLFPTMTSKTPNGGTVPLSWTSPCIDLDAMPPMDLTDKRAVSWLVAHTFLMFSNREVRIRMSSMKNSSGIHSDVRVSLKDGLFSIFMHYAGLKCLDAEIFALTTPDGVSQTLIFPSCLRLDLVNHTVVLDAAIIPLTKTMLSDPRVAQFVQELTNHDFCQIKVSEAEYQAWKAMMPALVERCRTVAAWKHIPSCEYVQVNEMPLSSKLTEDSASPVCSCGVGKSLPEDFLRSQLNKLPDLSYMISRYATRAAIAPIFPVPYVEDCSLPDLFRLIEKMGTVAIDDAGAMAKFFAIHRGVYNEEKCIVKEKCAACGKSQRVNGGAGEERLLRCSRCKVIRYCSAECQKVDWTKHKPSCSANRQFLPRGREGGADVFYIPTS